MTSDPGPDAQTVAQAFLAARRDGRGLPDYPGGVLPRSLDEGYRVQEQAIALSGQPIGGWKVGRVPDAFLATAGADRLAGPIFASQLVIAGDEPPLMEVFGGGFAAVEAEYLLRLGPLPDRFDRDWTNEDAAAHVDEVRVGIEVASSPFPGINAHGPAVTVSDFGNNNGLVVGARLPRDLDFLDWTVALTIDGIEAGTATAGAMLDGPFGAVRFLFELAAVRRLPLAAGQWISSGAVTGVHPVRPGARVEARFGDRYKVECRVA